MIKLLLIGILLLYGIKIRAEVVQQNVRELEGIEFGIEIKQLPCEIPFGTVSKKLKALYSVKELKIEFPEKKSFTPFYIYGKVPIVKKASRPLIWGRLECGIAKEKELSFYCSGLGVETKIFKNIRAGWMRTSLIIEITGGIYRNEEFIKSVIGVGKSEGNRIYLLGEWLAIEGDELLWWKRKVEMKITLTADYWDLPVIKEFSVEEEDIKIHHEVTFERSERKAKKAHFPLITSLFKHASISLGIKLEF